MTFEELLRQWLSEGIDTLTVGVVLNPATNTVTLRLCPGYGAKSVECSLTDNEVTVMDAPGEGEA